MKTKLGRPLQDNKISPQQKVPKPNPLVKILKNSSTTLEISLKKQKVPRRTEPFFQMLLSQTVNHIKNILSNSFAIISIFFQILYNLNSGYPRNLHPPPDNFFSIFS